MPGFPFPGRPGGEPDEPLLDMIIARRALPPDAPAMMHDLERMLAALAGPAEPGELTGEAAVRAAFSRAAAPAGVSSAARRPVRRRRSRGARGSVRSRARLAMAMVVAAAGLGSVLAAYTDSLPSPIQQLAHVAVAAPVPPSTTSSTRQPVTLGTGRQSGSASHKAEPASSQPAPQPRHSRAAAPAGRPAPATLKPRRKPWPSSSPGFRTPGPFCSAAASQPTHCTDLWPTVQPTPSPSIPSPYTP
jgi:hypothetical protein